MADDRDNPVVHEYDVVAEWYLTPATEEKIMRNLNHYHQGMEEVPLCHPVTVDNMAAHYNFRRCRRATLHVYVYADGTQRAVEIVG